MPLCSDERTSHDDVIKLKHFPRYWPFVWGIHWSTVNSPHKGQWRGALMFSLICAWTNPWVNNRDSGDLRRHCAHYDVAVIPTVRFPVTRVWQTLIPDNTIRNTRRSISQSIKNSSRPPNTTRCFNVFMKGYQAWPPSIKHNIKNNLWGAINFGLQTK